eukprot:3939797-Rhodomonas_salina.3
MLSDRQLDAMETALSERIGDLQDADDSFMRCMKAEEVCLGILRQRTRSECKQYERGMATTRNLRTLYNAQLQKKFSMWLGMLEVVSDCMVDYAKPRLQSILGTKRKLALQPVTEHTEPMGKSADHQAAFHTVIAGIDDFVVAIEHMVEDIRAYKSIDEDTGEDLLVRARQYIWEAGASRRTLCTVHSSPSVYNRGFDLKTLEELDHDMPPMQIEKPAMYTQARSRGMQAYQMRVELSRVLSDCH